MSGGHAHPAGIAGATDSRVHRLDPRAKLVGLALVTLVAVSAPAAAWPVWVACAGALCLVAAPAGVSPAVVWRRACVVLPPVLLVGAFVPFAADGRTVARLGPLAVSAEGVETFVTVAVKAAIGTTAIVLLGATTTFPKVVAAMEALRTPRLLTLTAALMYRYLFVVGGEVARMRHALAARGHRPRTLAGIAPLGRVVSALFLRSHGRGERVHLAMVARGWTSAMPAEPLRLRGADVAFVAGLAALLVPLRILLGVGP